MKSYVNLQFAVSCVMSSSWSTKYSKNMTNFKVDIDASSSYVYLLVFKWSVMLSCSNGITNQQVFCASYTFIMIMIFLKAHCFFNYLLQKRKALPKAYCRTSQPLYSTHISCLSWGEVPELCTYQRPQCRTRYNQLVLAGLTVSNTLPPPLWNRMRCVSPLTCI